ncbi:protein suppressor of forked [Folsomia candida]|uniref:protein suppressor of forked n=1 Tax=Folsomia candida TaxID=158441 RepID=UPI000B8F1BC5|nr:protein suppressor of forked [Folsomia candida]
MHFSNETVQKAYLATEENPFDMDAWNVLLRELQTRKIEDVRPLFEKLAKIFPTTGRFWKMYIEQEMKARLYDKVEKLFTRCLIKVLNIDLWRLYLQYIRESKAALPTYKEKMAQSYDFALDKIGMDIQSFSIWNDYANFLKSVEASGSYAENQRISAVRKVYQKAVMTPMISVETLWKDYITFEQGINPIIAEKMSMERSRDYMNARRVAKEHEAITRGLNRSFPSVPPTGSPEEVRQVALWKKYIAWEKNNPLRTEDLTLLARRVMFAYDQCLLCLSHHPDVWYEAALFLENISKLMNEKGDAVSAKKFSDQAADVYENAITGVLGKNMLLYFTYADFEETRVKYEKVHTIYQRLLDIEDIDPTLVYIQYMKFARRAEGIKNARAIFKKAREDPRSKYPIYVAASLMEYYCSKDHNIAFRIFELGLKKFPAEQDYIMCYVDYLSHLNEDNNTRVLFERVLTSGNLSPEKSVDIWNKFLEFESNIGDLSSIVKTEKRRSNVLNQLKEFEGKETAQIVDRYRFLDLFPCTTAELRSIGYTEVLSFSSSFKAQLPQFNVPDAAEAEEDVEDKTSRPDFSQMIPFKPKLNAYPGEHIIPGGSFPMPPAAAHLNTLLPPPMYFHGPFVGVEKLMDIFARLQLPEDVPTANGEGCEPSQFDLAKSVHWVVNSENENHHNNNHHQGHQNNMRGGGGRRGAKRRIGMGGGAQNHHDSEDEDSAVAPPLNDLYRVRQQKRHK